MIDEEAMLQGTMPTVARMVPKNGKASLEKLLGGKIFPLHHLAQRNKVTSQGS